MPSEHERSLINVAKAEDTFDLLNHIAWTDVVKPKLDEQITRYSKLLIAEALGTPIPGGLTREQVAGMAYGITYVSHLFEQILSRGEKALQDLNQTGVTLR